MLPDLVARLDGEARTEVARRARAIASCTRRTGSEHHAREQQVEQQQHEHEREDDQRP